MRLLGRRRRHSRWSGPARSIRPPTDADRHAHAGGSLDGESTGTRGPWPGRGPGGRRGRRRGGPSPPGPRLRKARGPRTGGLRPRAVDGRRFQTSPWPATGQSASPLAALNDAVVCAGWACFCGRWSRHSAARASARTAHAPASRWPWSHDCWRSRRYSRRCLPGPPKNSGPGTTSRLRRAVAQHAGRRHADAGEAGPGQGTAYFSIRSIRTRSPRHLVLGDSYASVVA